MSYNAAAFDAEEPGPPTAPPAPATGPVAPVGPASGATPEPSPAFIAPPQSGGFPQPYSGSFQHPPPGPSTAHPTGSYPQPPPAGGPGKPSSKKKPLLFGLGALIVVGLLVAGYFVFFTFSGIENSRGAIKNAQGFVGSATITWRASLPEEGITVGEDASCYYVLNDNAEITNQLACGPALRAGAEEGEVWDYYHYDVEGAGDDQQATDLADEPDIGQKAPEDGSIVDVEGNEPDDGADLEVPPLPKADADGVWMAESFTVDEASKGNAVELGADPRLISPGVQVIVSSIVEYSAATIGGQPAQAADGQKLFVIGLTGDPGPIPGSLPTSLDFDLNGTKTPGSSSPASLGETQILVSVPSSGESFMVLDSDGHQQMLNLTDGVRVEDATTELFYTGAPEPSVTLAEVIDFPATSVTETESFALSITFLNARMTPHDDEYGWPPAGQHWLIIEMATNGATSAADVSSFQYYSIDCAASAISDATTKSCQSDPGEGQTATWVATVTPATKAFSGTFQATMTVWGDAQEDAHVGFGPSPLAISFP